MFASYQARLPMPVSRKLSSLQRLPGSPDPLDSYMDDHGGHSFHGYSTNDSGLFRFTGGVMGKVL